jgi:hypothetical protein
LLLLVVNAQNFDIVCQNIFGNMTGKDLVCLAQLLFVDPMQGNGMQFVDCLKDSGRDCVIRFVHAFETMNVSASVGFVCKHQKPAIVHMAKTLQTLFSPSN